MLRNTVAAAVLLAGAALLPGAAHAASGYTVGRVEMRAGPDFDYPTVQVIRDGRRVDIYGCLNDWSWCDVGYRSDRGWVDGGHLVATYQGRRQTIITVAPYLGFGILSFTFGDYWDHHYRTRPFYSQRDRWENQYYDHFKPSWGKRPERRGSNQDHDGGRAHQPDQNRQQWNQSGGSQVDHNRQQLDQNRASQADQHRQETEKSQQRVNQDRANQAEQQRQQAEKSQQRVNQDRANQADQNRQQAEKSQQRVNQDRANQAEQNRPQTGKAPHQPDQGHADQPSSNNRQRSEPQAAPSPANPQQERSPQSPPKMDKKDNNEDENGGQGR